MKKDTILYNKSWKEFAERHMLTDEQYKQFQTYYDLLQETNELHNITAITDIKRILSDHFDDSLMLGAYDNMQAVTCIADVGSGGGFPGIPLKIKYPHLQVILIEVTHKKRVFLEQVITKLHLTKTEVCPYDWRTFLRKTDYPVELFCARASLPVSELLRAFKPACIYNQALIVYWASKHWIPSTQEESFIIRQVPYKVGNKQRKLIFLKKLRIA